MAIVVGLLIDYAVEIVAALAGLFATWAFKQAADWLGVRKDSEMYAWTEDQVDRALNQVEKKGKAQEVTVELDNQSIAEVVQTVTDNAPKYLKKLGLGEDELKRMVRERL